MERIEPFYVTGRVVHGFGRGSKELGCPTANLDPKTVQTQLPNNVKFGIYYGWAKLIDAPPNLSTQLHKMVASVGKNPFYKNENVSVEIHIIHQFPEDFYGSTLKVVFLGYLRGEKNFTSVDELIVAINKDISDSKNALESPDLQVFKDDNFFRHDDRTIPHVEHLF